VSFSFSLPKIKPFEIFLWPPKVRTMIIAFFVFFKTESRMFSTRNYEG